MSPLEHSLRLVSTLFCPLILDHGVCLIISVAGFKNSSFVNSARHFFFACGLQVLGEPRQECTLERPPFHLASGSLVTLPSSSGVLSDATHPLLACTFSIPTSTDGYARTRQGPTIHQALTYARLYIEPSLRFSRRARPASDRVDSEPRARLP